VIDHVSIPVRDLKQSAEFYESVLSKIGFAKLVAMHARPWGSGGSIRSSG
jgi:predicted enzyme related to lactoylglutathione lyase